MAADILEGLTPEELEELTLANSGPTEQPQPMQAPPTDLPISVESRPSSDVPNSTSAEVQKYIQGIYGDPERLNAARAERDKTYANTNLATAAANLAKGIGGRGWNEVDTAPALKAIEDQAAVHAADETGDMQRKQAAVMNFIQQKRLSDNQKMMAGRFAETQDRLKENAKTASEWNQKRYDQKDREIEAQRINKEITQNKPSDANSQAAGFGKRMQQAEADFADLEKQGYNRTDKTESARQVLPDYAQSPLGQRQNQAERNFLNAVLRRESGAAINKEEFSSGEKQYFPRLNDSPEVLAQKKRNRQQALESLKVAAGPAWDKVPLVENRDAPPPSGFDPSAAAAELAKRRGKK